MASIQLFLRGKITNDAGQHPVYIRITADQKSRYSSLGIWLKKSQWNSNKQEVRKRQSISDKSAIHNEVIAQVKANFNEAVKQNQARNRLRKLKGEPIKKITAEELKNHIFNTHSEIDKEMFIAYAKKRNDRIKSQDRYNTFKKKRSVLRKFEKYIQKLPSIPGSDIAFSDITLSFLKKYHRYLIEVVKNHKNTAYKDLKELGVFFNYAIKDETIDVQANPFSYLDMPKEKTSKEFLTGKELDSIIQLDLKKGSLIWHVRNYFFFQVYTAGLRVSDLCVVTWDAIMDGRFEYTMRKTDRHKSMILVEPARQLLGFYDDTRHENDTIFSILKNPLAKYNSKTEVDKEISRKTALLNKYLKKIEKKAKLKKHITTHVARHTFANMALLSGWSKEEIQKALAHSSISITEKYLSSFDDYKIDDSLQSLFKDAVWVNKITSAA